MERKGLGEISAGTGAEADLILAEQLNPKGEQRQQYDVLKTLATYRPPGGFTVPSRPT